MCFTIDQIEQACGLLLLNEFNTFIYCCKRCQCEFDSGPHLEVHILSEHQDDKGAVLVNHDIFVDEFEPALIVDEPTNVKIEQFQLNFEEPYTPNIEEPSVEEAKPPVVLLLNENISNVNTGIITTKNEVSFEENEKSTKESEENHDSPTKPSLETVHEVLLPTKRRAGRPPGAKNKKTINKESAKELIPKPVVKRAGRPPGAKNKKTIIKESEKELIPKRPKAPKKKSTNQQVFYCDMCPELSFQQKQSVLKHMTVRHMCIDRNMRKCEICNKFPRKSYEHHMKIFHSNHRYKCDFCNAEFRHNTSRVIHMRTHTGEKPFLCTTCGKAFISKSKCYSHETFVHQMVKKHHCTECDKSFIHRNDFENHINSIHTKERPFVCEICTKDFTSKRLLLSHKNTHNVTKFKCRYCDTMFQRKSSRWRHEMVFHKKVIMVGDKIMNMYKKSDRMKMMMIKGEIQQEEKSTLELK